jgi:integrase
MNLGIQIRSHDLRRAFATYLSQYVKDPDVLRRLLMHKHGDTSMAYVRRATVHELEPELEQIPIVRRVSAFAAKWNPPTDL